MCFWLFADPSNIRLQNNAVFYKEILAENEMKGIITPVGLQNTRPADDYRASEEFVTYERLCRGEETIVNKLSFFLFCCILCKRPWSFCKTCVAMKFVDDDDDDVLYTVSVQSCEQYLVN